MTTLAGRAVLVTGANRGMGREYVVQLLDRGVAKVYAGARDAATIDVDDSRVVAVQLDVTDPGFAAATEVVTDVSVLIPTARNHLTPTSSGRCWTGSNPAPPRYSPTSSLANPAAQLGQPRD